MKNLIYANITHFGTFPNFQKFEVGICPLTEEQGTASRRKDSASQECKTCYRRCPVTSRDKLHEVPNTVGKITK